MDIKSKLFDTHYYGYWLARNLKTMVAKNADFELEVKLSLGTSIHTLGPLIDLMKLHLMGMTFGEREILYWSNV